MSPSATPAWLQGLFDHATVGMAVARADGVLLVVNVAFADLVGRAAALLPGTSFSSFVNKEVAARLAALRPGDRLDVEVALRHGAARAQLNATREPNDAEGRLLLVLTDVTARHHAEAEHRESAARFEVTFAEAPYGIALVSTERVCIEVNRRLADMLGYAPEEMVGRPLATFIHPEEESFSRARFVAAVRGEPGPDNFVRRCRTRDGRVIWLEGKGSAVRDADGRPHHLIFQVADVTERVEAQQAIQASERRFRVAFEEAPFGMAILGMDTRFLSANNAACAMLGYAAEELAGMTWFDLVHPQYREESTPIESYLAETGRVEAERPVRRKDGTVIWIRGSGTVVRDEQGNGLYFLGQFLDVTDQRRADLERRGLEEQLRRSQRMEAVARLAGGVAHDFNNMLSVVINCAELCRMRTTDPRSLEYVEQIQKAATKAAGLTRRLLIFGRKDMVVQDVLDLNQVVSELRPLLQRTLGEDVRFELDLALSLRRVLLAVPHVEQVLLNLTVNARDAMPEGGRLVIRTANVDIGEADAHGLAPGRYVSLAVIDTGVGIPAEMQPLVFEPFFTTKEVGKGTGLGLSIVHHIVESAGGRIRLDSAAGKGTSFEILVPAVDAEPQAHPRASPMELSQGRGQRVMVVEDEAPLRDLVAQLLAENGYLPVIATGPEAALDLFKSPRTRVDLLVTDVVMPEMSGPELVRRVRRDRPQLPVLFMSGYAGDRLAPHDLQGIGTSFLAKPFHVAELLEAVQRALTAAKAS